MALAEQRVSIRRVRQNHVKSLRDPLADRPHQEISARVVDAASAVQADEPSLPGSITRSAWATGVSRKRTRSIPLATGISLTIGEPGAACPSAMASGATAANASRNVNREARRRRIPLAMDYQNPRWGRANLSTDVLASCRGRVEIVRERNANANGRGDPASGRGASPTRTHGRPFQWAEPCRVRSTWARAQAGRLVPTRPPSLSRRRR